MPELGTGTDAPAFNLPASNGKNVSLEEFKGKNIVLYFYPKDDTPGCTAEACGLRDSIKNFEKYNAVVLGVSPDPVSRHQKFIEKYGLPFILLSDETTKTCQEYGVWVEKNMAGRTYFGVARATFLIGPDGKITHIFEKVKPQGHEQEVLAFLKGGH